MIKRALSPAKPLMVQLNNALNPPRAKVVVQADEVSQAIGRGGINIRLASKLTGYEIDVYREISEEEEDIEMQEFADEIPEELLKMLRDIGCDTARAVLELSRDELMRRTGMEEAHAAHVLKVIKAEFADEEATEVSAVEAPVPAPAATKEKAAPAAEIVEPSAASVAEEGDGSEPETPAPSEEGGDAEADEVKS